MTTRSLNCFISSRFSLDSRLMSLMSSAMFSSFTTTIVSFSARLSVSSCVSFLSFLCFEQIPKKIANATDTPEISKETSIVNGVLLSELCRLDVVGVAVFPHVIFENIHLPVCLLYLLPEFRSDRLLDFRLFNDCLLFFTIADRFSVTSHNRDIISSGLILYHRRRIFLL